MAASIPSPDLRSSADPCAVWRRSSGDVRLVDWADEEGARFGKSLFGSSAAAESRHGGGARTEGQGRRRRCRRHSRSRDRFRDGERERRGIEERRGYLELHIEQGRCCWISISRSAPCSGTFGVERHASPFAVRRAFRQHADEPPARRPSSRRPRMSPEHLRDPPSAAAAAFARIGSCTTKPGIVTSVVEECRITLDQRHLDAAGVAAHAGRGEGRPRRALRPRAESA
jgi:N-carbamoyl-L-amino-acid hydrolase